MIDPTTLTALAASATAALIPLLQKAAAKGFEKLGESTAGTLFDKLKKKFAEAPDQQRALDKLAANPERDTAKTGAQNAIHEYLEDHPEFAQELKAWLQEAGAADTSGQTLTITGDHNKTVQVQGGQGHSVSIS